MAVLFVDLNGLKAINDGPGRHAAGDEAIDSFFEAAKSTHDGTLFRTGGDEFVLFALGSSVELVELGRRLLRAIGAKRVRDLTLSASAGVVLATDPTEPPNAIIERADKEMFRAKEHSRGRSPRPCVLAVQDHGVEEVGPE